MSYTANRPMTRITPADETAGLQVLSLGAGVQSSTMALMAAHGAIRPCPDVAIFADTQDEPQAVYDWLTWLEAQLPYPVYRVTRGALSAAATTLTTSRSGRRYHQVTLPVFTRNHNGHVGMMRRRQCTHMYKVEPIRWAIRVLAGVRTRDHQVRAVQWLGISRDEASRMRDSPVPWLTNRYPLIEQGMTRQDCLSWMQRHGYPRPPRSSCVYCPFHSDDDWRELRDRAPDDFHRAIQIEEALHADWHHPQIARMYLHRRLVPLAEVDLTTLEDHGQGRLWDHECEGMCGV